LKRLGGILRRLWEGIRWEDESTLTRPVGHPQQRDLSQRRVGIAAADVTVYACEPARSCGRGSVGVTYLVEAEAEPSAPESLPPVDGDPSS
jgi:hypothetical protein